MKLIGLVGYAGAGKTSVTNAANLQYGLNIHHMNFSTPITQMLLTAGVPSKMLIDKSRWNEPLDFLCGKRIRHAAQTLGTEWGRQHIGSDFWVRAALAKVPSDRHTIIDNLRFPNEMKILRDYGATFIAFHRPGLVPDTTHESEKYIKELQAQCDEDFYNSANTLELSAEYFANLLKRVLKE